MDMVQYRDYLKQIKTHISYIQNLELKKKQRFINQPQFVSTEIKVRIKHFLENRKILELQLSVQDSVEKIKELFWSNFDKQKNNMFISEMYLIKKRGGGGFKELLNGKIHELLIEDNDKIFIFLQPVMKFNKESITPGLTLKNDNHLIISEETLKKGNHFEGIFLQKELTKGTHYWEFQITKFQQLDNLLMGVARKDIARNINPLDTKGFWGLQPLIKKQFTENGQLQNFQIGFQVGEKIGFFYENTLNQGKLSIIKNNTKYDTIIENINQPVYPYVAIFATIGEIVLNPKAQLPKNLHSIYQLIY